LGTMALRLSCSLARTTSSSHETTKIGCTRSTARRCRTDCGRKIATRTMELRYDCFTHSRQGRSHSGSRSPYGKRQVLNSIHFALVSAGNSRCHYLCAASGLTQSAAAGLSSISVSTGLTDNAIASAALRLNTYSSGPETLNRR
uniref:Integron gene cassette protein n=1 Tax=Heligmosomoides polygyrus TaxID=6339 RepID=A0A183F8M8_HELPZ